MWKVTVGRNILQPCPAGLTFHLDCLGPLYSVTYGTASLGPLSRWPERGLLKIWSSLSIPGQLFLCHRMFGKLIVFVLIFITLHWLINP